MQRLLNMTDYIGRHGAGCGEIEEETAAFRKLSFLKWDMYFESSFIQICPEAVQMVLSVIIAQVIKFAQLFHVLFQTADSCG